jgi:DNA repair protein RecO (recombination protein O)
MPLSTTEAVVLKSFSWSESSRTVVFFTRDFGKLALVDKGGRRVKSRRGRLTPFTRLDVTFYNSERDTRGYVSDAEPLEWFMFEKEGTLGRLAYGSAACELLYLLLPEEEPQPSLYTYFVSFLKHIDADDRRSLPGLFVAFFLRVLSQLGYHPSLEYCVGCSKDYSEPGQAASPVLFSPERGGRVCQACQRVGEYYIGLSPEGFELLLRLQTASLDEAAALPVKYQDASQLVEALTKFLSYHSEVKSDLKSLEFLEKLRNSHLSGEKGNNEREKS